MTRETTAPSEMNGKFRVLIVDDDRDFVAGVSDALESRGYEIRSALNEKEACERTDDFLPEVVLLDVQLGRDNGIDLIPKLKAASPGMLCVMMTAYADVNTAIEALQRGAYDYLRKPLDMRELLSTIERCLERRTLEKEKSAAEHALKIQNEELKKINARLKAIVATTRDLAVCSEPRELGKAALEGFARNMAAEGGSLYLIEGDRLVLGHSLDPGHAPEIISLPLRKGSAFDRAMKEMAPILIADIEHENELQPSGWSNYRDTSALVVPLFEEDGQLVGLVSLHNKTWPPFTAQDREIALILAFYTREAVLATRALEELRKGEARFRQIFDHAPVMMHSVDTDAQIRHVNEKWLSETGYSREEVIGKPLLDFLTADSRSTLHEVLPQFWQHGYEVNVPYQYVTRAGRVMDVLLDSVVMDDPAWGSVSLSVVRDVTAHKRAQSAREYEHAQLLSVFDSLDAIIAVTDPATHEILFMNKYGEQIFGGNKLGHYCHKVFHGLDSPCDTCPNQTVIQLKGEPCKLEYHSEAVNRDFMVTNRMIRWPDGRELKLEISVDITERKRAEEKLLLLATAIDQCGETIEITDLEGTILYVNPAFERSTGYSRDEVVGSNPRILKSGHHDALFYKRMWSTITSGQVWSGHFVNKRKDGTVLEEEATISPVRDQSHKTVNFVAVKRDVTHEVLLQKQLLQAQKMEAVGTLAGGIAHDFNNLLQVIQGYCDMAFFELKRGQPGHSEVKEIAQAARSAAELTQGLLAFSRRVESKLRPVNLNRELDVVAKMLHRTIPKMIRIDLRLAEEIDTVSGDPAQLQQVVMNLAVNARDAMPDGGSLLIETSNVVLDADFCRRHLSVKPGRYVMLLVSDSGSGMDRKTVERVFDPFFTTKETGKGTGLGLSIVYGIVRSHGGYVLCSSEPGKGTAFRVYLPVFGPRFEEEAAEIREAPRGGPETILLVDDEDAVRWIADGVLTRFGYTVMTAANGREALGLFRDEKDRISLVVLDLIMPEMGGLECMAEIMKINPSVKVLIASGYSAEGKIEQALGQGARASVQKPYDANQLLRAVRQVLDAE